MNKLITKTLCYLVVVLLISSCKNYVLDSDRDGYANSIDQCPYEQGSILGCPDVDSDGIPDHLDACPNTAGAFDGCPDTDGDGIEDAQDNCPGEAGPQANDGCPWLDSDGDGILDKDDKCPYQPGDLEDGGCPAIEVIVTAPAPTPYLDLDATIPSGIEHIDRQFFKNAETFGDVNDILLNALRANGYSRYSYYQVDEGYAFATLIEQIDEESKSLSGNDRWVTDEIIVESKGWWSQILSANATRGYYRCFILVVSKNPYNKNEEAAQTPIAAAEVWGAANAGIPDEIAKEDYTKDFHIVALVYEFERSENDAEPTQKIPSNNLGEHLERSGILKSLRNAN